MGNWNEVLREINSGHDEVRRKYLGKLAKLTKRNVICYYSGWLQKTGPEFNNVVAITDEDKGALMSCFFELDFSVGLDFVIHSPGGRVTATESLIHYLRSKFGTDIRVFVPQLAMSGGTLLALSGKEIWMGNHSNLGPIDPQFGNIPAVTLLDEIGRAYLEIKEDPARMHVWAPILAQIPPTLLTQAKQAIDLSESIAVQTLCDGMFREANDREQRAALIAKELTNVKTHKEHGRHIHKEDCKKMGLKIFDLEDDGRLQDAVLTVHHAFMVTLSNTPAAKIVENHNGAAFVKNVAMQVKLG
jgi:hypothetical protein